MNRQFWNRNASIVLTCLGGVGVVATSVMAVKATPKALEKIEIAEQEVGVTKRLIISWTIPET